MKLDPSKHPSGFGGIVAGWHEIIPSDRDVLRLPADAIAEGPFLRIPDGQYEAIHVETLVEGFGNLERFLLDVASHLAPGGQLFLDAQNLSATPSLRIVLEGRPGRTDPAGSIREPEMRVDARRLLHALDAAGLLCDDFKRLPDSCEMPPSFTEAMIREGFMALSYTGLTPAVRFWVVAHKEATLPGSVLIGTGSLADQDLTEQSLRAFLPSEWEIVRCQGDDEPIGFNRGVATSQGEMLWFLRAGSRAGADLFDNLYGESVISATAPGTEDSLSNPGDVSGLMIPRIEVMATGPISPDWKSALVGYEDWCLRLESKGSTVRGVEGAFSTPPADSGDSTAVKEESELLMERWKAVGSESDPLYPGPRPKNVLTAPPPPWEGRKPTVSLCMMVKNEERFLGDCLAAASPVVDEIIIVDTGSTDRTIEIAESFGAKVYHQDWQDDFSAPRNLSLEKATGDWILVLDADETLDPEDYPAFREAICDSGVSGYNITFENLYTGGKTIGVVMMRLFRSLPGLVYVNRIHEQVSPSVLSEGEKVGLVLSVLDVTVTHKGYTDEIMDLRGKNKRNEDLFIRQLEEHPEDVYSLYKYGDFLRRVPGRSIDARNILEKTLGLLIREHPSCPQGIPYASEVAALCALEFARSDDYDTAEKIIEIAFRRFIPTPNLHYIAAGIAVHRGRPDEAIRHYKRCFLYRGLVLVVPIQEGITSYVSMTGIASSYLHKGDRVRARRYLERALAIKPDYDLTAMTLSRMSLEEGDFQTALSVLTNYLTVNPESAGACQQTTMILAQLGLVEQARSMGSRTIELLEKGALTIEANNLRKQLAALG